MKTTFKGSLRDGGTIVETTTTVETHPATIDYHDILEACEIVPDEDYGAPWDNCDGLEHTVTPAQRFDHDPSNMRGYMGRNVITVDREQVCKWGVFDYARQNGASKQVARELEALNVRKTIDYIARCYGEFQAFGITCDYLGEHASCWGFHDLDYAAHDAVHDIAAEIVHGLELRGYSVDHKPKRKTRYARKWEARRKLQSHSWIEKQDFDYRANEREFWR